MEGLLRTSSCEWTRWTWDPNLVRGAPKTTAQGRRRPFGRATFADMRKTTTLRSFGFTFVLGAVSLAAQGQFITLTDEWGNVVNGQVIEKWHDLSPSPPAVEVDVECVLNNSAITSVNMRRYELQIPAGTTYNYYCWGECYAPALSGTHPVWPAPQSNNLTPAEDYAGFHAYYQPMGVEGAACFRYVWFDDANPSDTTWVDICFNASPVGMEDHERNAFTFNAYPVPSNGGNVELTFDAPRANERMTVDLHDALGQLLATERIRTGQQRLVLGEGSLSPGLVFATLRVDGRTKATRRLVLGGH